MSSNNFISFLDYTVVWRYFSWSNQTLAMIALWAGATYLAKFVSKNASFIAAVPATFMSAVSCTYIMMAGEGLGLSASISYPVGIVFAVAMLGIFLFKCILKSDTKTA